MWDAGILEGRNKGLTDKDQAFWGLGFLLPQVRNLTGGPGPSGQPMSLESGLDSWWPPEVPAHISCSLGLDWAPASQSLGLYLGFASSQLDHTPGPNCPIQGPRLLWVGAAEGAQPSQDPVFSQSASLAMATPQRRPGNYPGCEF